MARSGRRQLLAQWPSEDREHAGDWRVERIDDDDGSCEVEIFSGPDAREQAIRYAASVRLGLRADRRQSRSRASSSARFCVSAKLKKSSASRSSVLARIIAATQAARAI